MRPGTHLNGYNDGVRARHHGAVLALLGAAAAGCVGILNLGDLTKVDCTVDCDGGSRDAPAAVGPEGAVLPGDAAGDRTAATDAGVADDGASLADTSTDPPIDAGCPATCNKECVANCNGCLNGNVLCEATRACGTCTACGTRTVQCFSCEGGAPVGTCGPEGAGCPLDDVRGACPCNVAAQCPGQTQVCAGTYCQTCGGAATQGETCKSGATCRMLPSPATCR